MSPVAGKSHDIVLKIDGEEYGFQLMKQEKGKAWEREPVQPLPPSLSSGGANYTNFPPNIDKPWVQDRWNRGMGYPQWLDDDPATHAGFHYSEGMYTRKDGFLHLGPAYERVTQPGGAAIGRGAQFHARFRTTIPITSSSIAAATVITTPQSHGLRTGDTVTISGHTGSTPSISGDYVVTVTGLRTFTIPVTVTVAGSGGNAAWEGDFFTVGNQLFKLTDDGASAVTVQTFPLTITHLFAFDTWLLVAQGDDDPHYYSTDGANWTVSAVSNAEATVFGSRLGVLWKARINEMRSATDPTVSWSGITEVGEPQQAIKDLYLHDNFLRIRKTDGLYSMNSAGVISHIYNEYPFESSVQAGLVHNQTIYFPEAYNLVQYNINGIIEDAGGGRFGRFSAPRVGRVWQLCEDGFFMYAAFEARDGSWHVLIHEELLDSSGGAGGHAWDNFVSLGADECKMVFVSDLYGENRRLYFGNGNDVSYVVLSRYHGDMLEDSNCRYINHGVLYGPVYHLSFAAAQKLFDRWSATRERLASAHRVALYYQIDGSGTWQLADVQEGTTQSDFLLGREETGVNIQPRWELWTTDPTTTPVIRDTVLHSRVRVTTSQHQSMRFSIEVTTAGDNRAARGREAVKESIDRLLALQYRATPIYLQDPIGEWWRVSIARAKEVLVSAQAGGEITFAVAMEAVSYDQYVPGPTYDAGFKYDDNEVYGRME